MLSGIFFSRHLTFQPSTNPWARWARDVDPARRLYDEPAQPPATATLAGEDMFMGARHAVGACRVLFRIQFAFSFCSGFV